MRTIQWAPTGLVLMWTLTGCPDANDETPGEGDTNTDSDTATDTSPPGNQAPDQASSPSPSDGDVGTSINTSLQWSCSDPDGDDVTADVYFSTSSSPSEVATDTTSSSYDPGTLDYSETYYWRVTCKDAETETTGSLWQFTTGCDAYDPCADAPTVTDVDGNTYATVEICGQCWMAENLKTGTQMGIDVSAGAGANTQPDDDVVQKFCFDGNSDYCDAFGGLYQWDEAMGHSTSAGTQGICPDGWHLPTDSEWKTLEMNLGMSSADADDASAWRGTDQGDQLKRNGESNFEALIGQGLVGTIPGMSYFDYQNTSTAEFWTSSRSSSNAYFRKVSEDQSGVYRALYSPDDTAISVRCIKD